VAPPRAITLTLLLALLPGLAAGQDMNILQPTDSIERLLVHGSFDIIDKRGSRFEGDRTSRTALTFDSGEMMIVKWAPAPRGGETFNNVPRYEAAAYEVQKLFLEEPDYVVPPTIIRALPLDWYRQLDRKAEPTFRGTQAVIIALQYWLYNVTDEDFWNEDRFDSDSAYARHFANFNLLTYLIHHSDENEGNFLISSDPDHPRVFAVDNGVAFSSEESDRGYHWRRLRVDRIPAATVARLVALTREDLRRQLATLVEWRVREDGSLERLEPGPPLIPRLGIRRGDGRIQLGLTDREIDAVWSRIERVVADLEDGDLQIF
jgi:hypothetical protein